MMKKIVSFVLVFVMIAGCIPAALAGRGYAEAQEQREYEAAVSRIMAHYAEDPQAATDALAALDTTLIQEPVVTEHAVSNDQTRGINPTDYSLSVYSFTRGGSAVIYLQWYLDSHRNELFYGPLDYVSIEWDTNRASYYAASGDGVISSVQDKSTGIVLFNVEDKKLDKGTSTYGTVQVWPSGSGLWLNFGSKYVHTYSAVSWSGEANYSFSPSASLSAAGIPSIGLSYTYGFKLNLSSSINQWQLWASNGTQI